MNPSWLPGLLVGHNGVDNMKQTLNCVPDRTGKVRMLAAGFLFQHFCVARNNGQWRPQLMRERVNAVIFALFGRLGRVM